MHRIGTLALVGASFLAAAAGALAQPGNAGSTNDTRNLATLAPVGEQRSGLWITSYGGGGPSFDVENAAFKPWARGLFDARQQHDLEPHARCKASGAVRQLLTPYGVEILELPELQRIYIFDIGGPHTYREIFLDGRGHPADPLPSNYGHNIGWWDGETLVVDSVGYNEDFWFERMGLPHTEAAQVTEYFRRRDERTIDYRFVMNDPLAYDGAVEGRLTMTWREGEELFEYVCQQGNFAFDLMVHPENLGAIGTSSAIVP